MSTVPTRTTADAVLADAPRADDDALLGCLHIITRLYGRPVSESALVAALPLRQEALTAADYVRAAENHGYTVRLARRRLGRIPALLLPATLILRDSAACVLTRQLPGARYEVVFPEAGPGPRTVGLAELEQSYSGYVLFTQPSAPAGGVAAAPGVGRRRSWFWGVLAAYSPYYLEAALSALLVNVLSVATALYIMNVYDRVVPNSAFATLLVLAFGTALAVGFEFCARTLRAYFLDAAGRKADLVLSSQIFAQAMGLRMATRPGSTGAFAAQIREFESVREFITSATLTALMDIPFVAFFIFIVYLIGGPIYLVPFLAVPLIVLIGLLAQWPLARTMNTNLREAAQRHGLLIESLEGMESVKALRAEGYLRGRYEDSCAHVGRSAHQARTISALVVNFTAATLQMVTVGMVFWGVYLIDAGELTVGALVACVMLIGRGLAPLQQVAALMMRYQQARAAYFTLQGLMGQPVERPTGKAYTHREAVQGALAMQDVHFTYPGSQQESLQGATFEIEAGEHVAILGRVGSGKSTLLRLLLGLFEPARGTVLLDGVDIAQFDPADLRRHLGYATQDANLFSGTLRENIALGQPHAADAAILEAVRIAGLAEFVAGHPAGLQRPVGERGQALSGGQRQAVAIARTLLLEPRVLLLDEPTSAMDHSTEQRFIGELARYAQGRTMLLVTHKPSMLVLAKRILVLDAGRVVMDGPRDEILRALTRPVEQQA